MVSLPSQTPLTPFCIPTFLYDVIGLVNELSDFAEHSFFEPSSLFLCLIG